jgi:hypothetical protein
VAARAKEVWSTQRDGPPSFAAALASGVSGLLDEGLDLIVNFYARTAKRVEVSDRTAPDVKRLSVTVNLAEELWQLGQG